MVVGSVTKVALARDGSEVLIDVNVEQEYAHLVRANSRFWNVSGVKADIGLTGGTIEVETVQSLLAGGIAFNTPEKEMGPTVKAGHSYPLHPKAEKEWQEWSPASSPDRSLTYVHPSPALCRACFTRRVFRIFLPL